MGKNLNVILKIGTTDESYYYISFVPSVHLQVTQSLPLKLQITHIGNSLRRYGGNVLSFALFWGLQL